MARTLETPVTLRETLQAEDKGFAKLVSLLAELSLAVVREIPRALGTTEGVNVYGEQQLQLDVWSNELFTRRLERSGLVRYLASEELDRAIDTGRGDYSVVLDPIDGSSNVGSNNLLGTIVGILHDQPLPARGRDLLASMYFLYGPYLELVIALRDGVYDFAVAGKGSGPERFLSNGRPLRIPEPGTIYGVGGLREKWTTRVRDFVETLERRQLKLRYSGSFVGDYNQVLKKGGFFAYPELVDAPQGKYRLQFEANPVAFITEKAGGRAITGTHRILDVEPMGIAQRVPTYVGTGELISEFEAFGREKS